HWGNAMGWCCVTSSEGRYLRDMLILDCATQHHPIAQHLAVKCARSLKRRQSRFARDASAKPRKVGEAYTPGGLYVGPASAVDLPDEQFISKRTPTAARARYAAWSGTFANLLGLCTYIGLFLAPYGLIKQGSSCYVGTQCRIIKVSRSYVSRDVWGLSEAH